MKKPLHDRVLVERVNSEDKTKGGIIIPDTAQEKPMEGKVLAVGGGARNENGQIVALDVKKVTEFYLVSGLALKLKLMVKNF